MLDIKDIFKDVRFKFPFRGMVGYKLHPLIKCNNGDVLYPLSVNNDDESVSLFLPYEGDFIDIDNEYELAHEAVSKRGGINIKESIDEVMLRTSYYILENEKVCEF